MWEIVAAFTIWAIPAAPPNIAQRPYVSCIDGHIVAKLSDCPPIPDHRRREQAPLGGGGSGLLGGLLGGLL